MLSQRIKNIEASAIRKIFELAVKSQNEYINLSIGQPHFSTPQKLKKAAKTAIDNNYNGYLSTLGDKKLRRKIAIKLLKENKIKAKPENIIITAGTSGAIFLSLSSIINPGDEIILPDPYFVLYKQIINFLGGKTIFLDTYPDFQINPEKLKKIITNKTKAIILNTPNNPTGAVYDKQTLKKVANIAKQKNVLIIADEIYEKFDYNQKFFSIGSVYKNTLTLNGFSKSHAIPGWRVGYAHGPSKIIEAMNKLQQYTFVCAPSFAQIALAEEIEAEPTKEYKKYKIKRDYVYNNLKNKYELNIPEGAFYAFIKIPKGRKNFIAEMISKKLLVVPGSAFSRQSNYFRLCFAVDDQTLKKGIEILQSLI